MPRDPWSRPKHPTTTSLTPHQLDTLRGLARHLRPVVRIGSHGHWDAVVGKTNAELDARELVLVEFVGFRPAEVARKVRELAELTASVLVQVKGTKAVFYRRHPSGSLEELVRRLDVR